MRGGPTRSRGAAAEAALPVAHGAAAAAGRSAAEVREAAATPALHAEDRAAPPQGQWRGRPLPEMAICKLKFDIALRDSGPPRMPEWGLPGTRETI